MSSTQEKKDKAAAQDHYTT